MKSTGIDFEQGNDHASTAGAPGTHRSRALVVLAVVVISLGALGYMLTRSTSSDERMVYGSADFHLPHRDATDWVSYADAVVTATVLSSRTEELTPHEETTGSGLINRRMVLQVNEVLWQSPTGNTVPESLRFRATVGGWVLLNGEEIVPFQIEGAPRLNVGDSAVLPIYYYEGNEPGRLDPGETRWSFVASPAVMIIGENGTIDPQQSRVAQDLADDLAQAGGGSGQTALTPESVASLLERTEPDPAVKPYMDMEPRDRVDAMLEASG